MSHWIIVGVPFGTQKKKTVISTIPDIDSSLGMLNVNNKKKKTYEKNTVTQPKCKYKDA